MKVTLSPHVTLPEPMVWEYVLPNLTQALPQDFSPAKIHIRNIVFEEEDWYSPYSQPFNKNVLFFFHSTYRIIQEQQDRPKSKNGCWLKAQNTVNLIVRNEKGMVEVHAHATVFCDLTDTENKTKRQGVNCSIFLGFAPKSN